HVIQLQEERRFAEARAILDQVPVSGSRDLQWRFERARTDLDLVERLDSIRLNRGNSTVFGNVHYEKSCRQYEALFREAGLGEFSEDPDRVAMRLGASPVRKALIAALDDWATCARPNQRMWALGVTRRMDPDPWRDRVRDQSQWAKLDVWAG